MSTVAEVSPARATEPIDRLLRDLRTRRDGLSPSEVDHRQVVHGPNEIARRGTRSWPRDLARQLVHPFALLLWAAAVLSLVEGSTVLAIAIAAVVVVNAVVAFFQEQQAERAIEALRSYLPHTARVLRGGRAVEVQARELVPGDVILIEEGTRISADARLLEGSLEVDLSSLTGESAPVRRAAHLTDVDVPLVEARDLVFSGSTCTGGNARAVVFATGMQTEIGRIAALSERAHPEPSPLERQVLRLAWVIAVVGVLAAAAFLLIGVLLADLPLADAFTFATGLLVANVPEGLLPTLTLALALAVRLLARTGALVKRLSAVETLGAATVICTDKTGTITENRMQVVELWTPAGSLRLQEAGDDDLGRPHWRSAAEVMSACNEAVVDPTSAEEQLGDPTEIALLLGAQQLGQDIEEATRRRARRATYPFDPELELMSTVDRAGERIVVHTKGAPEQVLARCNSILTAEDQVQPLSQEERASVADAVDDLARRGLRVLALAQRALERDVPAERDEVERSLALVGLAAMLDPPRPEVPPALAACRTAGIRVIMITGDYGPTAVAIARDVGLVDGNPTVVTGVEVDRVHDDELRALLGSGEPVIVARASPEAKLRVACALQHAGDVVAMTGDGVNDAPALRRADIGVAMGIAGTDVAREAATLILTDDNFATVVAAVREGRRVYDNIRKFIVYILAHLTPEIVPLLVFALSGGAIPLPLTVLQILIIDLGTETVPALALGRERAEPGLMHRPPRRRTDNLIDTRVMIRGWLLLGGVSAVLVMSGFLFTLWRGGWSPGAPVAVGTPLHEVYLGATTMTFLGIVVCQIGTAFAARTSRVSLLRAGVLGNRLLLLGIAFELVLAAAVVGVPPLQRLFATAVPPPEALLLLIPFPIIVWGADEIYRWLGRRHDAAAGRRRVPVHGSQALGEGAR